MTNDNKDFLLVGVITSAHGLKGGVKIKSFMEEPLNFKNYKFFYNSDGKKKYELKFHSLMPNGQIVAMIKDVFDRNVAETLKGMKLYLARKELPPVEDEEFYHADLIDAEVYDTDENFIGKVVSLFNFGAGDVLEIRTVDNKLVLINFSKIEVPHILLEQSKIITSRSLAEIYNMSKNIRD